MRGGDSRACGYPYGVLKAPGVHARGQHGGYPHRLLMPRCNSPPWSCGAWPAMVGDIGACASRLVRVVCARPRCVARFESRCAGRGAAAIRPGNSPGNGARRRVAKARFHSAHRLWLGGDPRLHYPLWRCGASPWSPFRHLFLPVYGCSRASIRSKRFAAACQKLNIKHKFTRAYRPQTNGKAERFIQSALREWAYGASPITTPRSALPCSVGGLTITTGIGRIKAFKAYLPSLALPGPETTS